MADLRWVRREVIDAVHLDQIREHGGMPGVRDENALEAALARARHKHEYEPDSDLATLAAAYTYAFSKSHPYHDGNKRIAFFAGMIFLGLNGKDLDATESEVVKVMTALAAGSLSESALATWMRTRLVPLAP